MFSLLGKTMLQGKLQCNHIFLYNSENEIINTCVKQSCFFCLLFLAAGVPSGGSTGKFGGGGFTPPSPQKKSSPYVGVSL